MKGGEEEAVSLGLGWEERGGIRRSGSASSVGGGVCFSDSG